AALGTAISFAKFIFLPRGGEGNAKSGFWAAMTILLSGLVIANCVYYDAYTISNIVKPLVTIGIGWLAYFVIFQRVTVKLPRVIEQFDHLIGVMSLMLTLLFWMVFV
ncbi:MAG: cation:proton antiporter, partial [Symploca sp. SIO1A3]|nr:cation:proton antiporter [Symploca sp. SIO1A3]